MRDRIFVFTSLRSAKNFKESDLVDDGEPIHPYSGSQWALGLSQLGYKVFFLSRASDIFSGILSGITNYVIYPKMAKLVVIYSTDGLGKVLLLRLLNWRSNLIFFHLSKVNPHGGQIKSRLRKFLRILDLKAATRIFYGLNSLNPGLGQLNVLCKSYYYPFYVDVDFYSLNRSHISNLVTQSSFILVVGDVTRDDKFLFNSLLKVDIPIIRVTRDPKVVYSAQEFLNLKRGDKILSGIGFSELASLYKACLCSVVCSKDDDWQPGGITSLVEALASGSICVANGGGEIESEFSHLAKLKKVNDPILYYSYPDSLDLMHAILRVVEMGDFQRQQLREDSVAFARYCLDWGRFGNEALSRIIE